MWMRGSPPAGRCTATSAHQRGQEEREVRARTIASPRAPGKSLQQRHERRPRRSHRRSPSAPALSVAARVSAVRSSPAASATGTSPRAAKAVSSGQQQFGQVPRKVRRKPTVIGCKTVACGPRSARHLSSWRGRARASICPTPPVTRRPRKSASSSMRAARRQAVRRMPNAASGCFASARSVTGSPSESTASANSRAKTPTGSRSSGAPAESSTASPQRPSSTATRRAMRAVRRHQRHRNLRRFNRFADGERDRRRFLLLVARHQQVDARERRASVGDGRLCPSVRRLRRPHRLGDQPDAPATGSGPARPTARHRRARCRAMRSGASIRIADGRGRLAAHRRRRSRPSLPRRDPGRGPAARRRRSACAVRSPSASRRSPEWSRSSPPPRWGRRAALRRRRGSARRGGSPDRRGRSRRDSAGHCAATIFRNSSVIWK